MFVELRNLPTGYADHRKSSLCQKNSLQPFLITGTIFQDLLVRFKVPESFLGLLFNFYQEIQTFEGSYAKVVSLQSPSDAKCFGSHLIFPSRTRWSS